MDDPLDDLNKLSETNCDEESREDSEIIDIDSEAFMCNICYNSVSVSNIQ